MEDILQQLGFTTKEAAVYRCLLERGSQTAAVVAKTCGEKRANTYVLLENLVTRGLATTSDDNPVRTFAAAHPSVLQKLIAEEQNRQLRLAAEFKAALPQLVSTYNLTNNKPGVVHMVGEEGFLTLLDNMTRSSTEVLLVASNKLPTDPRVLKRFRELLVERKKAGIKTRALFHHNAQESSFARLFAERGMDLRFLGDDEYTGELVIYEDNVVFTVYEPSLVVTVITNTAIAATMRQLFEHLWQ